MLPLLLDEQISPAVAAGLRRRVSVPIECIAQWQTGRFLGLSDELLLEEAARQSLTLVTYDRRTIPPLLKLWAEAGRRHAAVIFVDHESLRSSDFGSLIRALQALIAVAGKCDWTDRVITLQK